MQNAFIYLDVFASRNISVVSPELGALLRRPSAPVIPLGTELPTMSRKNQTPTSLVDIRLIYVGTLTGRKLETVIQGLADFIQQAPTAEITLKIVGDGFYGERESLEGLVQELKIGHHVKFLGYLSEKPLEEAFALANLGLVHVPNEARYATQPSTKLFEYWGRGIPIIGSVYPMNIQYVQDHLGILYPDSTVGFTQALHSISQGYTFSSAQEIRDYASQFSWDRIVAENLRKVLFRATGE